MPTRRGFFGKLFGGLVVALVGRGSRFQTFPTGTRVVLHGGECVVPLDGKSLASYMQRRLRGSGDAADVAVSYDENTRKFTIGRA